MSNYTKGPLRFDRRNRNTTVGNFVILEPDADGIEPCVAYVANVDDARLYAASPYLLEEMQRYLEVLERAESLPKIWSFLTKGTGIATANGYRAALAKATGAQP